MLSSRPDYGRLSLTSSGQDYATSVFADKDTNNSSASCTIYDSGKQGGADSNDDQRSSPHAVSTDSSPAHATFVPAWEGLRGVAVLMTAQSHNWRTYHNQLVVFGRGGVTVFFVLSGYLITGVLLRMQKKNNRRAGSFGHVGRFLTDRMVRLYPAVTVMLAVTASLVLYLRDGKWPFKLSLPYQVIRVLSYTSDLENGEMLWLATWTLSVEEQFYVTWAFVVPVLVACTPRMRLALLTLLLLMSYSTLIFGETGFRTLPYWLGSIWAPYCNVYKLIFGAMLQLVPPPQWVSSRSTGRICLLAFFGYIAYTFSGDYKTPMGWLSQQYFFVETTFSLLTAGILLSTEKHGNTILEHSALRFIGRVSYSFYLYQSPLQIAAHEQQGYAGVSLSALAFVCAMVSSLYIEEPLRQRYRDWRAGQISKHTLVQ